MGEPFPGIGFLVVTFSWELLFSALALIFFYIAGYPIIKNLRSQTLSLTDMYG
jgi:hypothetical protein